LNDFIYDIIFLRFIIINNIIMGFLQAVSVLLLTVVGYASATNKCITIGGVTLTHENWHLFTDGFTDGIWASVTSLDNNGNVYQA